MKKRILILFIGLITSRICFSQIVNSKIDSFKVVLDRSYSFTDCGIIMHKYDLKFTILNTNYSFIGIITCPEAYGKFSFLKGNKFLLETTKLSVTDSTYYNQRQKNPKENINLPVYTIVSVQKLK